jgi:DNA repair protein SbcC/Rad50
MRPIQLTMQAFGPYAGIETIDFTELGNRTMFVISGKTGSGKTTIFDGISYAIYGKASGEDRNGPELRSQFAKDELLTEVSLKFSLRGKIYFIKRSPQQDKKKERGDGYRTIGATAELYQYNENGEEQLLAANVRDVEEKIKEIMLIDSNQFRQILMIPQGEFRKLLTSDSKDKEAILQRLFHTEIYKRVEEKLKEEATGLKKSVEKQQEDRTRQIRKIHAIFNEELQALLHAESDNDVLILPLLEEEIEKMNAHLESTKKDIQEREKDKALLVQKLYDAESIVKQMKTRDELGARKVILESQKDIFEKKQKEITLANKAALLAKQEELCHRLKRELDHFVQDTKVREQKVAELGALLKVSEETWQREKGREQEHKAAQESVHSLEQMREEVNSFANLEKEVLKLQSELAQLKQKQKIAEESLKSNEEQLKLLQKEKESLEKTDVLFIENDRNLEKLENEMNLLTKYEQQWKKYKENTALLERNQGMFGQAQARLQDAKLLVEELETKWLHGQAANLANQLHDGEACPVCGSESHPNPASSADVEFPTDKDIKAAKEQVAEIEKEKTKAESAFLEVQSRTTSMKESLLEIRQEIVQNQSDFSEENLEAAKNYLKDQQRTLQAEQIRLKEAQIKLQHINQKLQQGDKQKTELQNSTVELTNKVNTASLLFTEKNTSLNGMKGRIPEELRSIQEFERKWKEAVQRQELLKQQYEKAQQDFQLAREQYSSEESSYKTVKKHAMEKETELKIEKEAFVAQMTAQGFEVYKQYAEAKRTEQQVAFLDKEIRDYREELRSVTDRYQELVEVLKDMKVPDVEGLQIAVKEVQDEINKLNDKHTNLLIKKRDNEEINDAITRINADMKALEERYKLVGELYDISRGQNNLRITFERYVLAAFLDDILREANSRLAKMTSGRYEMIRKTDRAKGNAQSGLELLVFDQYTGQERHVKTLSGGESFKAALSLALGLADVVQNYAGGVSLETMFIDEGFGTLDPESLDQAIEALIDIQSSGRLVGIISHVPELRERIDARLEVSATQSGSTTEFHFLN